MESNNISDEVRLWDFANAAIVAETASELLGASALTAVAWCALAARCDDRPTDYKFWSSVFAALKTMSPG